MESRRDQAQAYFFVVGRLAAAVTHGRPNVLELPNKRFRLGTMLGILIAVVLAAIFGIIGLFKPGGNTSWRSDGTVVVDEDTGSTYVYLDDRLHPVLNSASARLASGGSGRTVSVSTNSLRGTPVGQPIGIPDAPDVPPTADGLHKGPWTVCVSSDEDSDAPRVTLLLRSLAAPELGPDRTVLVTTSGDDVYLLWQGRRHRLTDPTMTEILGYGASVPLPVTPGWLNPIPQGADIGVPDTPGVGEPGPEIAGMPSRIGQVFEVRNPATESSQLYLLRRDGKAALNRTAAALLLAAPSTERAYPDGAPTPIEVGVGALANVPTSTSGPDLVATLPSTPPGVVEPPPNTALCARYDPADDRPTRLAFQFVPAASVNTDVTPVAEHVRGTTVDQVAIPLGGGALVTPEHAPEGGALPVHLVTAVGTRYPIASPEDLTALGYNESDVVGVPARLIDLLPRGPVLSTEAALRPRSPRMDQP